MVFPLPNPGVSQSSLPGGKYIEKHVFNIYLSLFEILKDV